MNTTLTGLAEAALRDRKWVLVVVEREQVDVGPVRAALLSASAPTDRLRVQSIRRPLLGHCFDLIVADVRLAAEERSVLLTKLTPGGRLIDRDHDRTPQR